MLRPRPPKHRADAGEQGFLREGLAQSGDHHAIGAGGVAVAKDKLTREQKSVGETAIAVGYETASGFGTAFSREIGRSPKEFIGGLRSAA